MNNKQIIKKTKDGQELKSALLKILQDLDVELSPKKSALKNHPDTKKKDGNTKT